MTDYKAILFYLSEQNFHHFTFHPQSDKPIKPVSHLPVNICTQDIVLDLQELGYDVISVKQMTNICLLLDG